MQDKALLLISIALAAIGIFVLLLLNLLMPPLLISPLESLSGLEDNQKILVEGLVTKEYQNKNSKILIVNNSTKLICIDCPLFSYSGKNISATAIIEKYSNKTYAKILRLELK